MLSFYLKYGFPKVIPQIAPLPWVSLYLLFLGLTMTTLTKIYFK